MKYSFSYKLNKDDLFDSSINYIRHAKTFYFDFIFTCCACVLIIYMIISGKFNNLSDIKKILLIGAALIFPVIQPILLYIRAGRQAKQLGDKTINLCFDEDKVYLNINTESTEILYENIYNVINYKNMILIFFNASTGQIMPIRIFNGRKEEFYTFIKNQIDIKRKNNNEENNSK